MLSRILPREERFFDLFEKMAEFIEEASQEFQRMLQDLPNAERYSIKIKDIEHNADEVTHKTVEMLHKTFITPLDREEIHQLITSMDDIVDCIEAASQRIFLYKIKQIAPEGISLASVCVRAASRLKIAVMGLSNLKNPEQVIKECIEINRLENEADHYLRLAMAKLFNEEPDTRQLIKLKEVYEFLESATDRCEDVANIIEGIVLEHA